MDFDHARAFLADIEASFNELPTLDRLTFGAEVSADAINTDTGLIIARVFPVPYLATYRGGVGRIVGEVVEVLGRCDCRTCHRETGSPRYVARVIGSPDLIVSHSRGSSYRVVGEPPQNPI